MAWQQRAGHLRRDAELLAAPRCQRCSSPFTQAHAAVEKCKAVARESLMKDAQKLRAERTAARKEKLKQEKQLVAQLEQQLQAETEEMEVLRQEKQRLQEEREELELEGAWQQHQLELEAAHVPGAVLPKLVEAELVRGRAQRTLTLSDKVLLGDRAPCSAGAATVLHEPRLCSRA
eukprot:XP_025002165.1 uncharacterized protein LOC112531369 [Gallus gallus]